MIAGVRGGWQTIIADLALILFMVTAAAMGRDGAGEVENPLPARAEPLAIYRSHPKSPQLSEWLANQARDDRQRLTIVSRYSEGGAQAAADAALALAANAAEAGVSARIVLEPGSNPEVLAVLAFDGTGDWHDDCRAFATNGAPRAAGKDNPCD